MGLDACAYSMNRTADRPAVDFEWPPQNKRRELAYWRKHHVLHDAMHNIYRRKGGCDRDFNVAPLLLTFEDIDELEARMESDPEWLDSRKGYDANFFLEARRELAKGRQIAYQAWY